MHIQKQQSMNFHTQIKMARVERGLTQAQLATKSKTNNTTVSQIENGSEVATIKTLKKIARALGKQLDINIY